LVKNQFGVNEMKISTNFLKFTISFPKVLDGGHFKW